MRSKWLVLGIAFFHRVNRDSVLQPQPTGSSYQLATYMCYGQITSCKQNPQPLLTFDISHEPDRWEHQIVFTKGKHDRPTLPFDANRPKSGFSSVRPSVLGDLYQYTALGPTDQLNRPNRPTDLESLPVRWHQASPLCRSPPCRSCAATDLWIADSRGRTRRIAAGCTWWPCRGRLRSGWLQRAPPGRRRRSYF